MFRCPVVFQRVVFVLASVVSLLGVAEARRVALVIGQNAYPGGASATTIGLTPLANPIGDARRMAAILEKHGFEVVACTGKDPGCYDLTRAGLLAALAKLEARAQGAELALVFFAGHGMETEQGNILAPVDAKVDCATWSVSRGVQRASGEGGPGQCRLAARPVGVAR